jgi:nucleotide-binding universal stress UspA family protein
MFNILVPVDGSENALLAVRHTLGLAALRGDTQVHLLNVQPRMNRHAGRFLSRSSLAEAQREAGLRRLGEAEDLLRESGVSYRSTVMAGEPSSAAAQYAVENGINQIVVGTARRSTLMRLLAGSFTNELVRRVNVPVAFVAGSRPGVLERIGVPAGVGIGITALLLAAD